MEHASNTIVDLVTGIVLLLLVAALTTMFSKRLDKLPLTILLVFVGIIISALGDTVPGLSVVQEFELTPELVLFVFIPTLIFESAFNLNARDVGRNILPILTLAIPGLLISTAIIGFIFTTFTEFDLLVALLLGAILSATDPVAVIAIFKQLGVPERLTVLVEGESLFNDATSLVVAGILAGLVVAGVFNPEVLLDGFTEFLIVFIGGAIVGYLLALVFGYTLGVVESDPAIEITLTTILAYFSFIIAEHVFHVSGIMAVVAAALVIGSWGKSKVSPSTSEFMEHFWEYLAFVANALIFIMVGMQIDLLVLWQSVDLIALVVIAMLISRAFVVFGVVPLLGKLPGSEPIEFPFRAVMYWGGLRGAIALAIVLALPDFEYKDTLTSIVMGAVLFTLVVQGLTIEKLVKYFGLDKLSFSDNLAKLDGDKRAREEGMTRLEGLVEGGFFSQRIASNIQEKCERNLHDLNKELTALNEKMSKEEATNLLAIRCLAREKSRIYELFRRGLINEWAFRELDHAVTVQLDEARHMGLMPTGDIKPSLSRFTGQMLTNALELIPGLGKLVERLSTTRVIRDYDVAWGRYRSANSVIKTVESIAKEGDIDGAITEEVKKIYESISKTSKAHIDEVADQYPEFVETIQEQLGQRLLLIAEHDSVEHSSEMGLLQEGIAKSILKEQSGRLRQLKQDNISASLEIEVAEILQKVPIFGSLTLEEFELLSGYFRARTVPRGKPIIREGDQGNSMFLIARGIANLQTKKQGTTEQVATLFAGDFFGEAALLHGTPRNATVLAATPCSLYELNKRDLEIIGSKYPNIKSAIEEVDRERLVDNTAD